MTVTVHGLSQLIIVSVQVTREAGKRCCPTRTAPRGSALRVPRGRVRTCLANTYGTCSFLLNAATDPLAMIVLHPQDGISHPTCGVSFYATDILEGPGVMVPSPCHVARWAQTRKDNEGLQCKPRSS